MDVISQAMNAKDLLLENDLLNEQGAEIAEKNAVVKILVVDDSPSIHENFHKILSSSKQNLATTQIAPLADFELDFAFQTKHALNLVQQARTVRQPYAMIFIDAEVSADNEFEVIKQLWDLDHHIQVIICMAPTDSNHYASLEKLGASDRLIIMKKPYNEIEIRQLAYTLAKKWRLLWLLQHQLDNLQNFVTEQSLESYDAISIIKKTLQLHDRALEACSDGIIIVDAKQPDLPITYVNAAFEKITGYSSNEAVGRNCRFLQKQDRDQADIAAMHEALHKQEPARVVLRNYRKDGTMFWNDLHIAPVKDSEGVVTHYIGVVMDITTQKFLENQLLHQATHDTLTGLPNRLLLLDRIEQAILHAKRQDLIVAILFFDFDQFKFINDSLGHQVGDMLLQAVSVRLAESTRESDTVARLGGDEFVIVLSGLKEVEDAIPIITKCRASLDIPFYIEDHQMILTSSIGVSFYPKDGQDPDSLLRHADTAMYYAKETGGNTYQVYSPSMNILAREKIEFENSLRKALEREEFVLYYQPVISLATGNIISTEVLLRWQNPKLGLVLPQDFIPITEETGLIGPLGQWLLQTACEQIKAWQKSGLLNVKVAVNLSAKQFILDDVPTMVASILEKTGLAPEYLELELTESMIMENSETIIKMLWKLREMGVTVVIDDFGTGYSSLSALKRLPVDKIKIDKAFIRHIGMNPNDASIVLAIISMASSMGLKVLAEGVETEDQLAFLRVHHCDEVQGYYFSEPVPAQSFLQLLREKPKFEMD